MGWVEGTFSAELTFSYVASPLPHSQVSGRGVAPGKSGNSSTGALKFVAILFCNTGD